ncbi:hypothetical protein BCV63_01430 [Cylindrospermopsis raciborskii CS-508]|nr:hypothetical protein [Cylindrospermopsis raciborskii]OHY32224.1 hypothetical protein BCV63_01430 [Cylindrospermopsis raciborskii CS-508]
MSPASGSVAGAMVPTVVLFSAVEKVAVALAKLGASLIPVTLTVTVWVAFKPLTSVAVMVRL